MSKDSTHLTMSYSYAPAVLNWSTPIAPINDESAEPCDAEQSELTPENIVHTPVIRKYLTVDEVKERYRIKSTATLWKWREYKGFPNPINGRIYSIESLDAWDKKDKCA
ncbi:hypothetical protein [Parendozoicomonas sp. Alg238-R29]|uniref:helix-turn-helix transcriptional regulator n=1 Tax=Parendozoicomonas sp. Alg238-R29 TaxID=2993446 RepID=UPI00248E6636|nr:hypothetical protein [Parendozoicomonas sp. Alg238-R29]